MSEFLALSREVAAFSMVSIYGGPSKIDGK